MGVHDFKCNKVPLFSRKSGNINTSMSAVPKLAFVPRSCYYCDVNKVIPQCMCQVSVGLKEVQMGSNDLKYNKVPLFARKPGNINTSMSAAQTIDVVPASRYYCDIKRPYHNVCAKFH